MEMKIRDVREKVDSGYPEKDDPGKDDLGKDDAIDSKQQQSINSKRL